ncbi:MAG: LysR substrate-binding domain-containing protein [Sphingopyxis sp.]
MKQDYIKLGGQLDGVEAFLRVAEHRSFSAAARDLGVSPSAISQTIRTLEERVGAPLFMRTTRSVGLTQAGEVFLAQAGPAMESLGAAFDSAHMLGERPAGLLRLNLPRAAIPHVIEPILGGFCAAYPDIEIEIYGEDEMIDLAESGFDAGIRLGESLRPDMVAMRVSAPFQLLIAGSPSYFEAHGHPQIPSDLRAHKCIRWRGPSGLSDHWTLIDGGRSIEVAVSGPMISNSNVAIRSAALIGLGLIYTAEPVLADALANGRLVQTLADHTPKSDGLFLYYPSRRQVMPKLRAFIDYVRDHGPRP